MTILVEQPLYSRPIEKLKTGQRLPGKLLSQGHFEDRSLANTGVGQRMQKAAFSFEYVEKMVGQHAPIILPHDGGLAVTVHGGDGMYLIIDLQKETARFLDMELYYDCDDSI